MKPMTMWKSVKLILMTWLMILPISSEFFRENGAAAVDLEESDVKSDKELGGSGSDSDFKGEAGPFREMRSFLKSPKVKFPLKSEDLRKKSKRTNECRLGKTAHEIGDFWHPDLGEPFGKMYCIECSCEQVQKKRRIVGRIRCKNVKNDCPSLDCNDAISVPGQCCKVCGQSYKNKDEPEIADMAIPIEEEDKGDSNYKEYAALLTPRSSALLKSSTGLGEPMTSGLASGRFLFIQKSLHYSFVFNEELPRPKFIQFVDAEGNVVEEQEVTLNNYQQDTRKVCGVWRKMPRVYRKLLKEEKLHAALVTEKWGQDEDRFIGGRIAKQKYVSSEMYSSLLEPSIQDGVGGMAVITVSPATGSIYSNVIFNGDFEEDRDIQISVRIEEASGVVVEETVTIPKIGERNSIEIRTILEVEQLEALGKGTLFMVIYSKRNPDFKLIGFIQARGTCDMFDAILEAEEDQISSPGGLAWVYPMPDGSWSFNLRLPQGDYLPHSFRLETEGEMLNELDFSPLRGNISRQLVSGMGPRHYQLLYEDNIELIVETDKTSLRGKLNHRMFGDAQLSSAPLIISPASNGSQGDIGKGLLWISVDDDCGLNYQMTLNDQQISPFPHELMRLDLIDSVELSAKGLPVKSYVLDYFEGRAHEGIYSDLSKMTFAHLKAGDGMFKVVRSSDSSMLASTFMKDVRVPQVCLPNLLTNNIDSPDYFLDSSEPEEEGDAPSGTLPTGKCYFEGRVRDEMTQWTPNNDSCAICTCYKGEVKCDSMICPKLSCANSILLTGECCRSCVSDYTISRTSSGGEGCNVEGDRFRPAGSSWHPYMAPNGFMVCTTCSCRPDSLSVECSREKCPALDCAPEDAIYPQALACCKTCPPKKKSDPDYISDAAAQRNGPNEQQILAAGGCKFRDELRTNGEQWAHRIEPFGYIPCVTCSCLNGKTKCGREKCPALTCDVKVQISGQCCQSCGDSGNLSKATIKTGLGSRGRKTATKTRTKF